MSSPCYFHSRSHHLYSDFFLSFPNLPLLSLPVSHVPVSLLLFALILLFNSSTFFLLLFPSFRSPSFILFPSHSHIPPRPLSSFVGVIHTVDNIVLKPQH